MTYDGTLLRTCILACHAWDVQDDRQTISKIVALGIVLITEDIEVLFANQMHLKKIKEMFEHVGKILNNHDSLREKLDNTKVVRKILRSLTHTRTRWILFKKVACYNT